MPQCLKTVACHPDGNSVVPIRVAGSTAFSNIGGWFGSVPDCRLSPLRFFALVDLILNLYVIGMGGVCSVHGTYPSLFAPTEILTGECFITRAATWWITGHILCRSPALEY